MDQRAQLPGLGSVLRWSAWIPLACLVGVRLYVRRFDGWGAWSAAPLFLLPVLLSGAFFLVSAFELRAERAAGGLRRGTLLACVLGAVPLLWFLWRAALRP